MSTTKNFLLTFTNLFEDRLDGLNERDKDLDDAGDVDPDCDGQIDAKDGGDVEGGLGDAHDNSDDDDSHCVPCSQQVCLLTPNLKKMI